MDSGQPATIGDGRYVVERRIGVGGCGAVYLAYDTVLNRWVAIKQIETADDISDPFLEARQLASLQHPNIVTIYDFFRSEGQTFVVMEYIPGQNINELSAPMALDFFATFARQSIDFTDTENTGGNDNSADANGSDAPIIRLVNLLIQEGINTRASDIHIEPFELETVIRYRVDGVMREVFSLTPALQLPLVSRIKILSGMRGMP
mgnify:CR=1 FL=1